MTPDIEAYAPYISAVFAGEHRQQGRIPFSVSDRTELGSNPVVRAFFKLLELGTSRLPAPAVMDLLDIPLVQRRFDIRPEERGLLAALGGGDPHPLGHRQRRSCPPGGAAF